MCNLLLVNRFPVIVQKWSNYHLLPNGVPLVYVPILSNLCKYRHKSDIPKD